MIHYVSGNIFDSKTQTIVNSVNCRGAMGKGLALEFRIRYPEMYKDYRKRCENGKVEIGFPYLFKTEDKWILNFPTKNDWKYPSKLEYIEKGLRYFVGCYRSWKINSIAFPQLGCGLGKLKWKEVKKVMGKYLKPLKLEVYIYENHVGSEPKGYEKFLLNMLNTLSNEEISLTFEISGNYSKKIVQHREKFGFFRHLQNIKNIDGIGIKTYQKIITAKNTENRQAKSSQLQLHL